MVRALHITQLRSALDGVYAADGRSLPQYTESPQEGLTVVRATHIAELRAAARALGGTPCYRSVSPASVAIPRAGGGGTVSLTATAGCAWSATTVPPWLSVTPANGIGSATLTYNATANPDASSRTATVSVSGASFKVTQAGEGTPDSCSSTLTPGSLEVQAKGGTGKITLTTGASCNWSVSEVPSWLSVTPLNGTGSTDLAFSAEANSTSAVRVAVVGVADSTFTVEQGAGAVPGPPFSLTSNRTRLLTTYANRFGKSAYQMWGEMSTVQKLVFLTITDLLGNRSYIENDTFQTIKASTDQCSVSGSSCTFGCQVPDPELINACTTVDSGQCLASGLCYEEQQPRTNFETALDHIETIYAILDNPCTTVPQTCVCGGGDNHRLYFKADDTLMVKIRNLGWGLPEWWRNYDLKKSHEPFTNSRATIAGQPRGQLHFWRYDWEYVRMQSDPRTGVEDVTDPHLVEIDIDYNVPHWSNPLCKYSGTYGFDLYRDLWGPRGNSAPLDLTYAPPPP